MVDLVRNQLRKVISNRAECKKALIDREYDINYPGPKVLDCQIETFKALLKEHEDLVSPRLPVVGPDSLMDDLRDLPDFKKVDGYGSLKSTKAATRPLNADEVDPIGSLLKRSEESTAAIHKVLAENLIAMRKILAENDAAMSGIVRTGPETVDVTLYHLGGVVVGVALEGDPCPKDLVVDGYTAHRIELPWGKK